MENIKYYNNLVGPIFHCLAGSGPSVYVYFCGASHLICQPFCRKQRQAAVKVLVGEFVGDTTGWGERGILQVLRDHNSQALGYGHVCQLLDDFVLQGPNGSHICIVTEAMGPTVFDIYRCLPPWISMPLPILKRISKHLLFALRYMHDDCDIIHTGMASSYSQTCATQIPSNRHKRR